MLVDNTAPQLEQWLREVYEQEGPNEALKRVLDMAEYVIPKLARVEHEGEVKVNYENLLDRLTSGHSPATDSAETSH